MSEAPTATQTQQSPAAPEVDNARSHADPNHNNVTVGEAPEIPPPPPPPAENDGSVQVDASASTAGTAAAAAGEASHTAEHKVAASGADSEESQVAAGPVLTTVVRVDGLPTGVTAQEVLQYFSICGHAQRVALLPVTITRPSTVAFLQFREENSVLMAEQLSETLFGDRCIYVYRFYNVRSLEEAVAVTQRQIAAAAQGTAAATGAGAGAGELTWWQRAANTVYDFRDRYIMKPETADDVRAAMLNKVASVQVSALNAQLTPAPRVVGKPTTEKYDYTPSQPQWGAAPAWSRRI